MKVKVNSYSVSTRMRLIDGTRVPKLFCVLFCVVSCDC